MQHVGIRSQDQLAADPGSHYPVRPMAVFVAILLDKQKRYPDFVFPYLFRYFCAEFCYSYCAHRCWLECVHMKMAVFSNWWSALLPSGEGLHPSSSRRLSAVSRAKTIIINNLFYCDLKVCYCILTQLCNINLHIVSCRRRLARSEL